VSQRVTLEVDGRGPLPVYRFPGVTDLGVDAFVTGRHGGVSSGPYASLNLGNHFGDEPAAVEQNRQRVAEAIGAPLHLVRQTHSSNVVFAHELTRETEADAILTRGDEAIAIMVADCVPILLVSTAEPLIGVVHAGWRGLVAGVIGNSLSHFGDAQTVRAFVGPAISAATYQVGPEVAAHFTDVEGALFPDEGDRSRLDLYAVVRHQLRHHGVADNAITISHDVTDGGQTFFSDRHERPCGRFALVARRTLVA
jgi:polyphenol oxidase